MRRSVSFLLLYLISSPVLSQDLDVDVFYHTPLGPDIGVLLKNTSKDDVNFTILYTPQNCKKLGLGIFQKIRTGSHVDISGVIQSGDFRTDYYSLGTVGFSVPCKVKIGVEIIDSLGKSEIFEQMINVDPEESRNFKGKYENIQQMEIKHNFIKMNETHFQYTLLIENMDDEEVYYVELSSVKVHCSKGNLLYQSTGNFPDGISNGRGAITSKSWRAYKFIFGSDTPTFSCTVETELRDLLNKNKVIYEGKVEKDSNKTGHP